MALQADIDILLSWSNTSQMKFNPSKCHNLCNKAVKAVPSYFLGHNLLTNVDSYPYLGVTVSSDLCWEKDINTIALKATRTLNFIRPTYTTVIWMPKPWPTFLSFVPYLSTLQPLGIHTGHVTLTR